MAGPQAAEPLSAKRFGNRIAMIARIAPNSPDCGRIRAPWPIRIR